MSDEMTIEVVPDSLAGTTVGEVGLEILDGEALEALVSHIQDEYPKAQTEMEARNKRVRRWRSNLEAFAADAPKNTPFKGSSNVTVGLAQSVIQALFGKIKGTFDARSPFVSVSSLIAEDEVIEQNKVVEKYLNLLAESPYDLNLAEVKNDLILEALTTGTAFPKVAWVVDSWRVKSDTQTEEEIVYHDGPAIIPLPIERVRYRRGVPDINRLEWIAMDTPMTDWELRSRASKGLYSVDAVEKILSSKRTTPTDNEEGQQEAEFSDVQETSSLYDISEIYIYWDIDDTGVPVDLFITMHVASGSVLKQQFNTTGARMITNGKFVHRANLLTGRGAGQMTESAQTEVTAIHNLRNDNMKIANMRMVAVKRTAGFQQQETLYPGKVFQLEDPSRDIAPIQLGEIYPSSLQAESNSWSIAQKAVGLSDNQMGFADATMGSRDSVRGSAMRLQQGDSILGTVTEGLKIMFSKIFLLVWIQCIANKERVLAREKENKRLSEKELQMLQAALDMPLSQVPMRMNFTIKTTDSEKTFEARRQNILSLTQIFAQYGTQTIPLAMQLFGPQGMQMKAQAPDLWNYMAKILTGSGKLMEEVFKFFGQFDSKEYVPDMSLLDQMFETAGQIGATFASMSQQPGMPAQGAPQSFAAPNPAAQAAPPGMMNR